MSKKLAIIAIIMTTVTVAISVTHLDPSKAGDEPTLETYPSPDLWAGPETQFFMSKLHAGHGGRFHFNVKRDTNENENFNLLNKRAANNMPVSSSSVATFLESENSAGQGGASGDGDGGGLDKSRAIK